MSQASKRARLELRNELLQIMLLAQMEPVGTKVEFTGPKSLFLNTAYDVMKKNDIENISILSTADPQVVYIVNTEGEPDDREPTD